MNKIEMIEKHTANILEQMNSDKTKHWGNTIVKVVIDSALINSYREFEDGAIITCASVDEAVRELDNLRLSGSPDCTMTTIVKVYETIHNLDTNEYVEHLAHEWPIGIFKKFANGEGVPAA